MPGQLEVLDGLIERLTHELHLALPLLPTYIHLIVSAIFPIYTAAHASLVRPTSAASVDKKQNDDADDDTEVEETSSNIETLTPSDAILFPVMAGCTLASLYFILKFLQDPAWLNWFLGLYFACIGFFFMMKFLQDGFSVVRSALLPRQYSAVDKVWVADNKEQRYVAKNEAKAEMYETNPFPGLLRNVPLPSRLKVVIWKLRRLVYTKARLEFSIRNLMHLKMPVEALDLVSLTLTTLVIGYHTFIDKPWYLTNILGFSFCYGSLQFMTPGTSWTGTLLLMALFFYDIYFVFFTPMMVTVATKLDVPIKLLFPRPDGCVLPVGAAEGSEAMEEYLRCVAKKRTMAMLGLGDIVIPGMMLAFALRFDLYLFYLRQTKTPDSKKGTESKAEKPKYSPATGAWGERFWIARKFHPHLFAGKRFPKPYFYATVTGYVVGMLTTVLVMQIANHAQPALLYLVPGVLISLWGTALVKGDIKTLWNYSEMPVDETAPKKIDKEKSSDSEIKQIAEPGNESANASQEVVKKDDGGDGKSSAKTQDNATKPAETLAPLNHLIYFAIVLPEKERNLAQGLERIESERDAVKTSQ